MAWRTRAPAKGLTFNFSLADYGPMPMVPCGQCLGCRMDWAADWAVRCEKEAKMWEHNCFITLTYDDAHLPIGSTTRSTVSKRELQLFIKRLRKEKGAGIRFFGCGEYGEKSERAHYHVLLFNCSFDDRVLWKNARGNSLWRSPTLEQLWPFGFSSIGDLNYKTANYVARYTMKKLRGAPAEEAYKDREAPFVLMSRRPGIGATWFQRWQADVYPSGKIVYGEGRTRRAPRYFDKLFSREKPIEHRLLKHERKLKAQTARMASNPSRVGEAREKGIAVRLSNLHPTL